jgi:hypothetical protein
MKKHILGVALFCLIVASFAFIYAFFYAPSIPSKEAVKPPLSRTETRPEKPSSLPEKFKNVAYEVENAHLQLNSKKFTAVIRLKWKGSEEPPLKLFVSPKLFTLDVTKKYGFDVADTTLYNYNPKEASFDVAKILNEPFRFSYEKKIFIESRIPEANKIGAKQNLYVVFDVFEPGQSLENFNFQNRLAEAKPVLLSPGITFTADSAK